MSEVMARIEVSGGFHDADPIMVRIPLRVWASQMSYLSMLSDGQRKRVQKHFCGIPSCTCGGAARATWTLVSHNLIPR